MEYSVRATFPIAADQKQGASRRCACLLSACLLLIVSSIAGYAQKISSIDLNAAAAKVKVPATAPVAFNKLIVIGFLGGHVSANNLVHQEALLIQKLQDGHPLKLHAAAFANRDGDAALQSILRLLDEDHDGHLSQLEKQTARIVIFGHSWGASETVALADRLNKLGIPVLLTIQVDSVQKQRENDALIPPNVREAINFYQSEGLLRGREAIEAMDPSHTKMLGNYQSSYRANPVPLDGFPWYARTFMKQHIEIENDPAVWNRIEELILTKLS
jgi:hypothetical protein